MKRGSPWPSPACASSATRADRKSPPPKGGGGVVIDRTLRPLHPPPPAAPDGPPPHRCATGRRRGSRPRLRLPHGNPLPALGPARAAHHGRRPRRRPTAPGGAAVSWLRRSAGPSAQVCGGGEGGGLAGL